MIDMKPWVLRVGVAAVAYAITLMIAALLLERFRINALPFVIAVAIFTAVTVLFKPVVAKYAGRYAHGATWLVGLVTSWVALLVTDILSSGIQIEGFFTWVLAVLIVWAGTVAYDVIDDKAIAATEAQLKRLQ